MNDPKMKMRDLLFNGRLKIEGRLNQFGKPGTPLRDMLGRLAAHLHRVEFVLEKAHTAKAQQETVRMLKSIELQLHCEGVVTESNESDDVDFDDERFTQMQAVVDELCEQADHRDADFHTKYE